MKRLLLIGLLVLSAISVNYLSAQTFVSTSPSNKNVILEEYTGVNCGYCPDGHLRANQIVANNPGRAWAINIHQGGYANVTPNYTTSFGNALANQTGLTGYPSGTVNRHVFSGTVTSLNRGEWASAAAQILAQSSYVNVAAKSTIDYIDRKLTVKVEVYYTADGAATNKLNVALLQNNVLGPQSGMSGNPSQVEGSQYRHMHMLRHLLTGQWGEDIQTTTQGTFVEKTYTYIIPEHLNNVNYDLGNLEVIVFIAEGQQEIITGAKSEMEMTENIPVITNISIPTSVMVNNQVDFSCDVMSVGEITKYNWEFQNGTPATSNNASGNVSWSVGGSYEVKLTVENSLGTSAPMTKTVNVISTDNGFLYDFENCTDFAVDKFDPCTTYDGDGAATYSINGATYENAGYTGSFIAFNQSQVSGLSNWDAHSGNKMGACFASVDGANNDWFILPQISVGYNGVFKFWARSITDQYGKERFNVLVSTTDNNIASFTKISTGNYIEAPTAWTEYSYDLKAYAGQQVYLAIQCVSNDAFAFFIDDIEVKFDPMVQTADLLTFKFNGITAVNEDFDADAKTVAITVPYGTDLTTLKAEFTLSAGAKAYIGTVEQVSGVTPNDFTSPVQYTIKSSDESITNNWTVTVTIDASISELIKNNIKIYPNPTSDILNINHVSGANIEIVNLLGQTIKSVNNISEYQKINVVDLEQGTYFVKVIINETTVDYKVVITK